MSRVLMGLTVLVVVLGLSVQPGRANDFKPQLQQFFDSTMKAWLSDPAVVDAVKAQNAANGSLDAGAIDALDKQWRAEKKAGGCPLIDKVLANALSKALAARKATTDGLVSEVFVMDAKGLNVGQSDPTSDYMQGDEAKWQQTFQAGPDAVFIDEVEYDESSKAFQSQVSATVKDPATGQAIGAMTVGVNVEKL